MVCIRVVLVGVRHRLVSMPVTVPSSGSDRHVVLVMMVHIVLMLVFVIHRLMGMHVDVMLGKVEPHACRHNERSDRELPSHGLVEEQYR